MVLQHNMLRRSSYKGLTPPVSKASGGHRRSRGHTRALTPPQRPPIIRVLSGQVAQLVEQRTENPCVGSSILPLATNNKSENIR